VLKFLFITLFIFGYGEGVFPSLLAIESSNRPLLKRVRKISSNFKKIRRSGIYPLTIIERKNKHYYFQYEKSLGDDLLFLRNEYLGVYDAKSEGPILWSEQNIKGSNVFYHSMKAIHFFMDLFQMMNRPELFHDIEFPVSVRVDMDTSYSMITKFTNRPDYNNARTTPDGEIWFHRPKRKYYKKYPLKFWVKVPIARNSLLGTRSPPSDLALVSDVIYHEWTHIFTRKYLSSRFKTLINEAYSDYYAAAISGKSYLAKVPYFSHKRHWKNFGRIKFPGNVIFDSSKCWQSEDCINYLPSVFWGMRAILGAENTNRLLMMALVKLRARSSTEDLQLSLLESLENIIFSRARQKAKVYVMKYLNLKAMLIESKKEDRFDIEFDPFLDEF
jgi:hypothetical protein